MQMSCPPGIQNLPLSACLRVKMQTKGFSNNQNTNKELAWEPKCAPKCPIESQNAIKCPSESLKALQSVLLGVKTCNKSLFGS